MNALDAELLQRLSEDRALASLVLFGHRHPQAESSMHVEIMDLARSGDELVEIEAFREAGKTTKLEEHTILASCFGNIHYGLVLGETYDKACQRMAAMDLECRANEKLLSVFGGRVLARKSNENKMWFVSGTVLQAVGWEQELQSFKEGTHRPDYAWLDDVENKERVRDRAAVDWSMDKLYDELLPAMDQLAMKVINSQTRLAEDCMVTRLATDPNWLYRGYPICNGEVDDPRTVSAWPARYPMEWIRKTRDRYARKAESFARVYLLQAVNPAAKPFRAFAFGAMDPSPWHWMPRYVIYDPSRSINERRTREVDQSARTGKVVVSRMGSKIIVHESGGYFWKPSELQDDLFASNRKHNPVKVAVEKSSLDEWLLEPLRLRMLRTGEVVPLAALNAPQDRSKEDFIGALQPFFASGDIVLVGGPAAHPQLVAEKENFPQGLRDVLNALAYSLRMFAGSPVYEDFNGSNIGDAPVPKAGEVVHVAFHAGVAEVVAVAVTRDVRRFHVARDWAQSGALVDAVKTVAFELRATYPRAVFQVWIPSEIYDQWQRVPLLPALRAERFSPYRGEHVAIARGSLAELIRNEWRQKKRLVVDRLAARTLNALAAGYAYPAERGGRTGAQPEGGTSKLIGEALECMLAKLVATGEEAGIPKGAHVDQTRSGQTYISARPR